MALAYRWADGILAVSHGVADDIVKTLRISKAKVTVAYNPVDIQSARELGEKSPSHPWFSESGIDVIVAAGRLTKQKDFPTLIRSIARVRSTRDVRLIILGEGEERANLQFLISLLKLDDFIYLPGFELNPFSYFSHAKLFVLSSAWEGLPNVLIQAMACGVPVISTDCPSGPREILENGKWGDLVPVGEDACMARAIVASLTTNEHPDATMRAADFNLAIAVDRYLSVLDRATHSRMV